MYGISLIHDDMGRQRNKQNSSNETDTLAGVDSARIWRDRLDSDESERENDGMTRFVDILSESVGLNIEHTVFSQTLMVNQLNTTRQLLEFVVRRNLSFFGHR